MTERVAAGTGSAAVAAAISVAVGATAARAGAASLPDIGGASGSETATRALAVGEEDALAEDAFAEAAFAVEDAFAGDAFVEDTFALEVEAAESEAEAGVEADAGRPRLSAAKADGDNGDAKTAKNMAATATLTSSPPWSERKRARATMTIEC